MCETCGCGAAQENHHHTHLALPVKGLTPKLVKEVELTLTSLPGVSAIETDTEAGNIAFALEENGNLGNVKEALQQLGLEM
jgi:hypothetical protein